MSQLMIVGALLVSSLAAGSHSITIGQRVLTPEDGLLLGNGDLSVSVYQTADRIVFRLGKGDVWDRRLDLSDDPRPAHIDEIAHGIKVEGWKCPPYGGPVEATRGTKSPQRMRELCQGSPPSYRHRPYPCPKPVGELSMQLPPDLTGMTIRQHLAIEDALCSIQCQWPSGVAVHVECFVPPATNVLVVHWRLENWNAENRIGKRQPVWFSLYRWADPRIEDFAARFAGEYRHNAFAAYCDPKVTPLAAPTIAQAQGFPSLEQTFPPDRLFPDGFRYLVTPLSARAAVAAVKSGSVAEARLHLLPPPGASEGWVTVAVSTSSDPGGALGEARRIKGLFDRNGPRQLQTWQAENRESARQFWSQSQIETGDALVENLWYETLHARRCAYRRGTVPPGLFLPSTVLDYSHWHGDYHTNYNIQEPFWGDYTANHLELGDSYFDAIRFFLPIGRKIARDYYGCRGVFIQLSGYPIDAADDPLGVVPMGRMAYMTGWTVNQYWWRYRYTLDERWLRETGYPVIRDGALFYTDFLKRGEDRLYHAFPSNQGEDGFTGDPKGYTDRAQVIEHARYCLRIAILASETLALDEELRNQWRDRLTHCAPSEGRPEPNREGLEAECYAASPPEFGVGRPYTPRPAAPLAKKATIAADNYHRVWYFGQYPWHLMHQLRSGSFLPERHYPVFRELIQRWRHANGLVWGMSVADYGHCGVWTESLGVIAPLQEMMLQSWDGALRIFPAWPADVDARFENLRAEGALLVSARWSGGRVRGLTIRSERGAPCCLCNPWAEGVKIKDATNQGVEVTSLPRQRIRFRTRPGMVYALEPAKPL